MALVRPLPLHDSKLSSEGIYTDDTKELNQQPLLDTSKKEQLSRLLPPHSRLNLKSALRIALVLIFAVSYLTFCWIVHYHTVPIGGSGVLGLPFVHCEQYLRYANNIVTDSLPFFSSHHRVWNYNRSYFDHLCRIVAYKGHYRRDQSVSHCSFSAYTNLNSSSFLLV